MRGALGYDVMKLGGCEWVTDARAVEHDGPREIKELHFDLCFGRRFGKVGEKASCKPLVVERAARLALVLDPAVFVCNGVGGAGGKVVCPGSPTRPWGRGWGWGGTRGLIENG